MRHWIIANGLSLNITPLDLLKDEITWGMNRIHMHYKKTSWRPTYFLMVDFNQQNKPIDYWKDCIRAHWKTPKFLWEGFRSGDKGYSDLGDGIGEVPSTTWIPRCKRHHYYMATNYRKRAESWHLPEICTAFSGIGAMMQLAVLNGATELCLVGADLYESDYRQNFFDPNYTDDPRDRSELDNTNMNYVHTVARRSSPVPIYNCTIGGKLEVHPRRDFYEVLHAQEEIHRTGPQ